MLKTPRYLGCDEVGGVTRRHEQAVLCPQLFGETKVADPDGLGVPALVHVEDVAGLQVSVHHLQPQHNKSGVKDHRLIGINRPFNKKQNAFLPSFLKMSRLPSPLSPAEIRFLNDNMIIQNLEGCDP